MIENCYKERAARTFVLKQELLTLLNSKLSEYKECENCRFVSILELGEENEDGCNWLGANVSWICNGDLSEQCRPFVSRVLSEAGKQYNIKK